jgi:hypothetical protein
MRYSGGCKMLADEGRRGIFASTELGTCMKVASHLHNLRLKRDNTTAQMV